MEKLRSRVVLSGLGIMLVLLMLVFPVRANQVMRIGVIQIVEHPSLDAARQGFIDLLTEKGYVAGEKVSYDLQNAQGDISIANTIAQKFLVERPDLILAIATPTAQAVANVITDIPILITAVTDPVAAGLVESMELPNTNVSGTTDLTPVAKQIELLLKFQPDTGKVGIIYNAGEVNSLVQVEIARRVCQEKGLKLVEVTADTSSNVLQAAQSLAGRVDAFYVPTDNTVVSAIESVVMVAEDYDLPLIVGEADSVERGGLATEGLSYYSLGRQTGEMALKVLRGETRVENLPIESQQTTKLVINAAAAAKMGIKIPAQLTEAADQIINQ
ncbi:MAG: ABC transporter substrate-binding protein [Halanaerobiales bacterium]|nr:ABC transporter substrate-binding protein [Halanaerobiales bacterium]